MAARQGGGGGRLKTLYRQVFLSAHSHSAAALMLAAGLQAVRFFMLARGLGVVVFGQLMVFQAMAEIVIGLVALGGGEIMTRQVARDPSRFGAALGHALVATTATALVLSAVITPLALLFGFGVAVPVLAVFFLGELMGSRLAAICEQAFVVRGAIGAANAVKVGYAAARLAAVLLGIHLLGFDALADWMLVQGLTTLVTGLVCLAFTIMRLGPPRLALQFGELGFGALIALTVFATSLQTTVDRIFLGAIAAPSVVSIYAAARRAIELGEIPILAMLRNLFPEFFKTGSSGTRKTLDVALASLRRLLLTAGLAVMGILLAADVLAFLLGPGFEETAPVLRWLSLIVLLRGVQFLLANVLTASGHQALRTAIEMGAGLVYIAAVIALTFAFGLPGLIASIYLSQLATIAALAIVLRRLVREEQVA